MSFLTRSCIPLAISVGLAVSLSMASTSAKKSSQQEERNVDKGTYKNEPIEIVGLKNKKGKFKLGQKIKDDDEWLDGLTVTVANRTSKTISSVVIDVIFHRPENDRTSNDPPYVYTLHFSANPFFPEYELRDKSKVIRPGEAVDITVSEEDYRQIKEFLRQAEYPASIKRVQLVIKAVGYEDGTIWSGGTTFKRDPNNPNRILEEEEKSGREQQLPAGFLAAGLYGPTRFFIANAAWVACSGADVRGVWEERLAAEGVVRRDIPTGRASDVLEGLRHAQHEQYRQEQPTL